MMNFSGKMYIIWYPSINWHGRNSAYSTLRMQNCSVSTDSMRSCCIVFIYFLHSCLLLSATAPVGSQLTCSASSLLPVPILCLSSLAWLLQIQWRGKRKAFASPFTSCFHRGVALLDLWCQAFPLRSNHHSFDLGLGSCCSSANPLVSSILRPSHHLICLQYCSPSHKPFAASRLWVSHGPCAWSDCLGLRLLWSAVSTLSPSVSSIPPSSSSRENHMTEQTSSVENVLSVPNSMAPKLSWIFASLLISIYLFKSSPVSFAKKERSSCALPLIQSEYSSVSLPCLIHVQVLSFLSILQAMNFSYSPICHEVGWNLIL